MDWVWWGHHSIYPVCKSALFEQCYNCICLCVQKSSFDTCLTSKRSRCWARSRCWQQRILLHSTSLLVWEMYSKALFVHSIQRHSDQSLQMMLERSRWGSILKFSSGPLHRMSKFLPWQNWIIQEPKWRGMRLYHWTCRLLCW